MSDDPVFNTKFVKVVEKYPCIYDFTRKDHSRREVIEKAWKAVEAEVKFPVAQCKGKWKNLRTAFSRSMKTPRSGSGVSRKKYYLKDVMQFILPFMKSKPQTDNLPTIEGTATNLLNDCSNDSAESQTRSSYPDDSSPPDHPPSVTEIGNSQKACSCSLADTETQKGNKRATVVTNEADKSFIGYTKWKNVKTVTMSENSIPKLDFLKSLLPDLEKMNDYQLRQFKKRTLDTIDSILCDAPSQNFSFVPVPTPSPGLTLEHSSQSYSKQRPSDSPNQQIKQERLQNYLQNFTDQVPNDMLS